MMLLWRQCDICSCGVLPTSNFKVLFSSTCRLRAQLQAVKCFLLLSNTLCSSGARGNRNVRCSIDFCTRITIIFVTQTLFSLRIHSLFNCWSTLSRVSRSHRFGTGVRHTSSSDKHETVRRIEELVTYYYFNTLPIALPEHSCIVGIQFFRLL